jgi:hypothetical protein
MAMTVTAICTPVDSSHGVAPGAVHHVRWRRPKQRLQHECIHMPHPSQGNMHWTHVNIPSTAGLHTCMQGLHSRADTPVVTLRDLKVHAGCEC